jgi:hypothetical protein
MGQAGVGTCRCALNKRQWRRDATGHLGPEPRIAGFGDVAGAAIEGVFAALAVDFVITPLGEYLVVPDSSFPSRAVRTDGVPRP